VLRRGTLLLLLTHGLVVTLVTSATHLRADDKTDSDGDRTVNVNVGGKSMPIKVRDMSDPLQKTDMSDPLDHQKVFSETNSMANKAFEAPGNNFKKADLNDKNSFVTKSYIDQNEKNSAYFAKAETHSAAFTKGNHDFDKGYFTASADSQVNHPFLTANNTSEDQNRAAVLGGPDKQDLAANPMSNKTYLGPGAQNVPDGLDVKENMILTRVNDIPTRALTIDEVRNLINSGTKPNFDEKPEEPSKALNDPDYKPEPLRGDPSPPPVPGYLQHADDDKDDAVPSPGMMSHPPENSDALPGQKQP
jgi:hypothetical protein